jgi:hypothetical protein
MLFPILTLPATDRGNRWIVSASLRTAVSMEISKAAP